MTSVVTHHAYDNRAQRAVDATMQDPDSVQSVYQPIVELVTGSVVGYEALARWPRIGDVNPEAVFAAARGDGVALEVEWACRMAAINGALNAGLDNGTTLFINIEPTLGRRGWPPPEASLTQLRLAAQNLRVVLEITERALLADPAELLAVVKWARDHGCGVAVDDVGANPQTLALLPFIDPDVVKLDRTLIQHRPTPAHARALEYALAHVELSGARVIAEGIETESHLEQAKSFGAQCGQGWLLGHPRPLPPTPVPSAETPPSITIPFRDAEQIPVVPSELFAVTRPRVARAQLLGSMARAIEEQALNTTQPLSVLAAVRLPTRFSAEVADRYAALAALHPFVALLGPAGLTGHPSVHTALIDESESFANEWTIVVVGPHSAVALIAHDLGDDRDDMNDEQRTFEFVLTHQRDSVVAAGRSLIGRILPRHAAPDGQTDRMDM